MTLGKFLFNKVVVSDLVLLRIDGWQVGCTMIDHANLFITSLSSSFLSREVESFYYEKQDWTTKNVMIVNLK